LREPFSRPSRLTTSRTKPEKPATGHACPNTGWPTQPLIIACVPSSEVEANAELDFALGEGCSKAQRLDRPDRTSSLHIKSGKPYAPALAWDSMTEPSKLIDTDEF